MLHFFPLMKDKGPSKNSYRNKQEHMKYFKNKTITV